MAGLFMFAVVIAAIIFFVKATSTGKKIAAGAGIIGFIIGSSAGIAHSGGATDASVLFAAIGVILGSLFSQNPTSNTDGSQPDTTSDENNSGASRSFAPPPPPNKSESGNPNPGSEPHPGSPNGSPSRTGGAADMATTTREHRGTPEEEPEPKALSFFDEVFESHRRNLAGPENERFSQLATPYSIQKDAESSIDRKLDALRSSNSFRSDPETCMNIAEASIHDSLTVISGGMKLVAAEVPERHSAIIRDLAKLALYESLPLLEPKPVEKAAQPISILYAMIAGGYVFGNRSAKLKDKSLAAQIDGVAKRIGSYSHNLETDVAHICVKSEIIAPRLIDDLRDKYPIPLD